MSKNDTKDSDIIYETIEKATKTANEAEDASFAGLLQESIKKYLAAANQYLEVLKFTRDEETIKGMSFLAEIQRAKAKELMQKIEEVHPVFIHRSNYYGNVNSPETPSTQHSHSNPVLPMKKVSSAPRDFSWQRFWQHVEELLEILPKPIFDDPSLVFIEGNEDASTENDDKNKDNPNNNNNNNNNNDNNNDNNSNENKLNTKKSGNSQTPTRLNSTFPPLQKMAPEDDFFEIQADNELPKKGNLFFPILPIENYDPSQLPSITVQKANNISKDEKIRLLEEENKMLKLSIVRFRQELQVKAKKLHIFEPTEDDLKSHEIECGIGMYIGKQLQKIGQLELDVSALRTNLADLTQKYQEQVQRNEKLEKRWNNLKQLARNSKDTI